MKHRYLAHCVSLSALFLAGVTCAEEIEEVTVISQIDDRLLNDDGQPVKVIDKEALKADTGDTLGALLQNTPGVANASFGQGVGRPVLRGLGGARVKVMMNGVSSEDVSAMSSDHAAMVDPVNADKIEVIQGPATLFYGASAIGGIVNVVKQRIHDQTFEGVSGTFTTKFSSADEGKQLTGMTDIGFNQWILHLEGFGRKTEDYQSGANIFMDKVINSDVKGSGGNVALTWVDDQKGFVGLSVSQLDYDYAIPNPDNEDARITPKKTVYEIKTESRLSSGFIKTWSNAISYSQYQHEELDEDTVEGLFKKDSWQAKSWIHHEIINNVEGSLGLDFTYQDLGVCHDHDGCSNIPDWNQPWEGSKGSNFDSVNGYDFSHDNPMPLTKTYDYGIFVIEKTPWSKGLLELGARFGYRLISADPSPIRVASRQDKAYYQDKHFETVNLNAGADWALNNSHKLGLTLAHSQRAPEAEELFYNGDHHATFSYQLDNPDLDTETAYTLNLNWAYEIECLQASLNVFYYAFDGFIFNALQSFTDPYDHHNPVYRHEQRDATFSGSELEIHWQPFSQIAALSLGFFADYVKAQLTHGNNRNLPRIPPASFGLQTVYNKDYWFWQMDVRSFAKQSDVAENETETDGYSTFNMQARFEKPMGSQTYWVSIKANNLTDEYGDNAVSYLKRYAPVMGRNFILEMGVSF